MPKELTQVTNNKQHIVDSRMMIAGIALSIVTVAVFAVYFFGHNIQIDAFQDFLDSIHKITNMNWYVGFGGGILGATSIASMISSVPSKVRSKNSSKSVISTFVPNQNRSKFTNFSSVSSPQSEISKRSKTIKEITTDILSIAKTWRF